MTEGLPQPESDDLGRYLEDTITIDWQTPVLTTRAKSLLEGAGDAEERVRRLFEFVRDEIASSVDVAADIEAGRQPCRASEVLEAGHGLDFAKSHLLAGLLRYAGFPTGFCYARLNASDRPGEFVLHGFNAVYWRPTDSWVFLDACGGHGDVVAEIRFEPPWRLASAPDAGKGEAFLPFIYKRPGRRIVDLLERAPDLSAILRSRPDRL